MTSKPLTHKTLATALLYWQDRLALRDWSIQAVIVRQSELPEATLGCCMVSENQRAAKISLLCEQDAEGQDFWTPYQWELTLIHEMLHIHLHGLDPDHEWGRGRQIVMEQAINAISEALYEEFLRRQDASTEEDR